MGLLAKYRTGSIRHEAGPPPAPNADGYIILKDNDTSVLSAQVSQKMQAGWEPAGGVASGVANGTFYQAMVKRPVRGVMVPTK